MRGSIQRFIVRSGEKLGEELQPQTIAITITDHGHDPSRGWKLKLHHVTGFYVDCSAQSHTCSAYYAATSKKRDGLNPVQCDDANRQIGRISWPSPRVFGVANFC